MDSKSEKLKVPSELYLAAVLTGSITIVLSVTYTVLCILALVFRFQCDLGQLSSSTADRYFISTLYSIYIQQESCNNPDAALPAGVLLMSADTVFIFIIIILVASILTCATAIGLISVVSLENTVDYIFAVSWTYVGICVLSLAADITFAVFFGIDYAEMMYAMENTIPGSVANYKNDIFRLGSLLFMTVSLKGYLVPIINTVLLILLAVYATKYRNKLQNDEHSIHKMGAINAYDSSPRSNRSFVPDEEPRRSPRSPARAERLTPLSTYSNNRDYDRSSSWQHSPAHSQRPFSYMEEPHRDREPRAPSESWRRDPWPPAPPVPAPDYSPQQARRLKSALKPNYM